MENRHKIFKKLFGTEDNNIADIVIISPFLGVKSFSRHFDNAEDFRGLFFQGATGNFGKKRVTFIKTGIGASLVGDAVLSLPDKAYEGVYFLGAAGALNNLNIGDVVLITAAKDGGDFISLLGNKDKLNTAVNYCAGTDIFNQAVKFLKKTKEQFKTTDVVSIGSLFFETKQNIYRLKKSNVKCLDMETAAFYAACAKKQIPALSICFISDRPQDAPFWLDFDAGIKEKLAEVINYSIKLMLKIAINVKVDKLKQKDTKAVLDAEIKRLAQKFKNSEGKKLLKIINSLRLSRNKAVQFLEIIYELCRRDEVLSDKILLNCKCREILEHNNLSFDRKYALIFTNLEKMRYKRYFKEKEYLDMLLARLKMPKSVRIDPSCFFENKNLRFSFDIDSTESFSRALKLLTCLEDNPALKHIFEYESKLR